MCKVEIGHTISRGRGSLQGGAIELTAPLGRVGANSIAPPCSIHGACANNVDKEGVGN